MRKNEVIITVIILMSFILGALFYPRMPESMASHWNAMGEVDGYVQKFWGVFLFPIIIILVFLFVILIPRIDPLKANIEKFRIYYDDFSVVLILFFFYLYALTLLWNLGIAFNMMQLLSPAFAVLLYYSAVMMENSKRNWFIGIQTPWTLSSEKVWNRTHKLGGKLFKMAAVVALLGILLPSYAILFILLPVVLASVCVVLYSYSEYQKEH
ncbi:SdpI family protein [Candidatus Micrarchaeota archaeon]|nr:SdpI family protein [Candidatus Micrarchaeota archaeon]